MGLREQLFRYRPCNAQEEADRRRMLDCLDRFPDVLTRDNALCHFTGSSWIANADRTRVLMVYHNIYRSWAWTGGHADGERDLLAVALREAQEETGAVCSPIDGVACSSDILPVQAHVKRGQPVAAHVHLNLAFALECEEDAPLRIKPDENSGVAWLDLTDLPSRISPEDAALMLPIYEKIVRQYSSVRWPAQP